MNIAAQLAEAKKEDSFACPYCSVYALFIFNKSREVADIKIREAVCPRCNRAIIQIRELIYLQEEGLLKSRSLIPGIYKKWVLAWPRKSLLCNDQNIPAEIKKDMNEAYSIVDISPGAAACLARRVLERILRKYLSLKGKNLKELINASQDKVHPRIFELLDSVRGYGVFGAHLKDDSVNGEILDVQDEEVGFILEVVKELIDEEFVKKARFKQMLEQLVAKKERAKKG